MKNATIEFQVEMRKRPRIDEIIAVVQQNSLRWYGHVLHKENYDQVKKCMEGFRLVGWGLTALLTQFRSYCAFKVKTLL